MSTQQAQPAATPAHPQQDSGQNPRAHAPGTQPQRGPDVATLPGLMFDISGIDLSQRVSTKQDIEQLIPHRGLMSLVDGVVWCKEGWTQFLGVKHVRDDEFWVPGHFPGKPTLPGVLMVETAAQLSCYAFLAPLKMQGLVLFLRIENCAFRAAAFPGDDLYILGRDVKRQRRRFVSDVQGIVLGRGAPKIAFEAQVSGMMVDGSDF